MNRDYIFVNRNTCPSRLDSVASTTVFLGAMMNLWPLRTSNSMEFVGKSTNNRVIIQVSETSVCGQSASSLSFRRMARRQAHPTSGLQFCPCTSEENTDHRLSFFLTYSMPTVIYLLNDQWCTSLLFALEVSPRTRVRR